MSPENRPNQDTDTQNMPHSGNLGIEKPVDRFDSTTLNEAVDAGYIQTPEDASTLTNAEVKRKHSLRNRMLAVLAGIGVVGAAGFAGVELATGGSHGATPNKDLKANSKPTTAATPEASSSSQTTATPEKTVDPETITYPELDAASMEIPTTLTPEQVGVALQDRITRWKMAGATFENQQKWLASGNNGAQVLYDIANANEKVVEDSLLAPDWKTYPDTETIVRNMVPVNAHSIELWMRTDHAKDGLAQSIPGDIAPYHEWDTADPSDVSVKLKTKDELIIDINGVQHEERNNRVDTQYASDNPSVDGDTYTEHVDFTAIDGKWKISEMSIK